MDLSDKFITDWSRFKSLCDHLADFLVTFRGPRLPIVTCTGVPPVGSVAVPPLCVTLWSSNTDFKEAAVTLALDLLDLALIMSVRFSLIVPLVQLWGFPLAISDKHLLHILITVGVVEVLGWLVDDLAVSGTRTDLNCSGKTENPPCPGGLFSLTISHTVQSQTCLSLADLVEGDATRKFSNMGQWGIFLSTAGSGF